MAHNEYGICGAASRHEAKLQVFDAHLLSLEVINVRFVYIRKRPGAETGLIPGCSWLSAYLVLVGLVL